VVTLDATSALEPDARAHLELIEEGKQLGRYLLRSEPASTAAERYARACLRVFGSAASPQDRAVLDFIRRHPWSLPFLDAAAALREPQALLRKKLFLMLSILETVPAHVHEFSPQPRPRVIAILRIVWFAGVSVILLALGALIYGRARRTP
jgi:hypothetical protein